MILFSFVSSPSHAKSLNIAHGRADRRWVGAGDAGCRRPSNVHECADHIGSQIRVALNHLRRIVGFWQQIRDFCKSQLLPPIFEKLEASP